GAWRSRGKSPTPGPGGSSTAEAGATSECVVTAAAPIHSELRAALDVLTAWIDYRIAYFSLPGMAVAVVRDQDLLWSRGFGLADVERGIPATPGTRYRVGSVTKLFTATAVMQLRDEGKLDLDDTVKRHLPWFALAGEGGSPPPDLTIRQLLSHTSGLPREAAFAYWDTLEFPPTALVRGGLLRQSTAREPETQWKYSTLAMTLAGEIVAAVSGLPSPRYVERRILEPLGMASTIVDGIAPHDPRLARGYGRRFPRVPRQPRETGDIGGLVPAGNMGTARESLARFPIVQFRARAPSENPALSG